MKTFQLFFMILVLALSTQDLKANYEYFSAFEGIDAVKSKMLQDGFTDQKLIFIGAYETIIGGLIPNEADNGKLQNWYYTFVCNNDSRLITLSVIKQDNQLITALVDDCPSDSKRKIPFFSDILTDFREIPSYLIDSDSITLEFFDIVSKISTSQFNEEITTSIWRIELASKENLEKEHLQSVLDEDYLWDVELNTQDSQIMGSGTGAVRFFISAVTGETREFGFTVGVNDENFTDYFTIYPNPASDYITISIPEINPTVNRGVEGEQEIKIFNTLGECVMSVWTGLDLSTQRIDISHLPTGVYFIRFGNKVEKFVKM
ncbi:MAG: T9SS type A sorting domain-containing protein [Candidatus Kapabacteria bacterium]|nr:T9SS type A sorting domain-containing protein [Ignavibacteriota bacterium]MCW5885877.1 T9SS type A sorting domain-containing protein [Candidatus Kapabacteria bacterium]